MPSAIKKQREYGDDLAVIFVSGSSSRDEIEKFTWNRGWRGTSAMWTQEAPLRTGANGIPNFALLGADGQLLMKGHPGAMASKVKKAIEEEIKKGKKAPEGAPKSLKGAYKSLGKGDFAKAHAAASKLVEKGHADAKLAEDFVAGVEDRIDRQFKRVDWLLERGYAIKADEVFDALKAGVKGLESYEERMASLGEVMDSDQVKAELKVDKGLTKLEEKLGEEGLDPKLLKKLAKFADKNADSRVTKRAQKLLEIAGQ